MEAEPEQSTGDTLDGFCLDLYRYRMDFPFMGICLIINNVNFHPYTRMPALSGCDYDAVNVVNTFKSVGYDVRMFKNLTTGAMRTELERVSQEDHRNNASFVCVILSHGSKDQVYGTNGPIELNNLTRCFKGNRCESLLRKPKLFFINACRGDAGDEGADVVDAALEPVTYTLPLEADFLFAHSTTDGYVAWMQEDGSCFIKVLCDTIQKHRDLELLQMMTRVNGIMAYDFGVWSQEGVPRGEVGLFKQMPSVTSMLTKEFYFPKRFCRF